jgi:hypothetical protein
MDKKMDTPYMNKTVLAALKEHWLYLSLLISLFTLCSASVNALQIVLRYSSHESTAKWETCQIFKEDRLLVCLAGIYVTKMVTLLGVSKAAVFTVMTEYANHGKTSTAKRKSG